MKEGIIALGGNEDVYNGIRIGLDVATMLSPGGGGKAGAVDNAAGLVAKHGDDAARLAAGHGGDAARAAGSAGKAANNAAGAGGATNKTVTNTGHSRARDNSTPNSIYEQIADDGTVQSRTFYDDAGRRFSRQDFTQSHYNKELQQELKPHEHNFTFNDVGQRDGKSVIPLPPGYTNKPSG
jgi:hypothetical protein